jgi:hypothetical protein
MLESLTARGCKKNSVFAFLLLFVFSAVGVAMSPDAIAQSPPSATFVVHGGAYIWHYEPRINGAKANTEPDAARLSFDSSLDDFSDSRP